VPIRAVEVAGGRHEEGCPAVATTQDVLIAATQSTLATVIAKGQTESSGVQNPFVAVQNTFVAVIAVGSAVQIFTKKLVPSLVTLWETNSKTKLHGTGEIKCERKI
jgi:hypothetical protein